VRCEECTAEIKALAEKWVRALDLPTPDLYVTTSRQRFESWLGRSVRPSIGGGYIFLVQQKRHCVLINLQRIDLSRPKSLEIVICEELLHMRHRLDGDIRRHAKHGHDRIAQEVAELTGSTLDEVRGALLPVKREPYRYRYECPVCRRSVLRRRQGLWSCGTCCAKFSREHILQLAEVFTPKQRKAEQMHLNVESRVQE